MKTINYRDFIYAALCLSFSLIIGAGIFEHCAVWPHAYAAPPASLSMFQGEYSLSPGVFWSFIHPLTLLLFIVVAVLSHKTPRRPNVWIAFSGYLIILVVTSLYFVPELISITSTPFSVEVDAGLQARGARWINLSMIRSFCLMGLAIFLFLGLRKSGDKIRPV